MEHDAEHEPEAGPSSPRASPGVLDMSLDVVGDGELDEAEVLEVENNGMDEAGTIDYSSAAYRRWTIDTLPAASVNESKRFMQQPKNQKQMQATGSRISKMMLCGYLPASHRKNRLT